MWSQNFTKLTDKITKGTLNPLRGLWRSDIKGWQGGVTVLSPRETMAKTHSVAIETYLGRHKRGKKTVVLNEHLFPVNIPDTEPTPMEKEHPQEYERVREYAYKTWGIRL